jgi:N-acyl homoserine lactone hydrolase
MKRFPLLSAVIIAALGALATGAAQAAGLERLYILNCGEGVAGDISRWSPGVNVGQSMPFVDNCYLLKHAQGWLLWDTGVPDAIAAMPDGQKPADPKATHWYRPQTLARQLEALGVQARRHHVRRRVAHAWGPHRQCRAVPAGDVARAKGRV